MTEALKVLIIEDDPDVALGCEQALQLEGIAAECRRQRRAGPPPAGPRLSRRRRQRHTAAKNGRHELPA
jgi:hypothetical protein